MPLTDHNGVRLHWDERGDGSPLLLIMGAGLSSRLWYPAVPALSAAHRVITFDNRGTGESQPQLPRRRRRDLDGVGFGLGFAVVLDPVKLRGASSAGESSWGGAAGTAVWVDPVEDVTAVFMTPLLPSGTHPIRPQLRQLVSSAMVS